MFRVLAIPAEGTVSSGLASLEEQKCDPISLAAQFDGFPVDNEAFEWDMRESGKFWECCPLPFQYQYADDTTNRRPALRVTVWFFSQEEVGRPYP